MITTGKFDFTRTFQHPAAQRGHVEMIPTEWFKSLAKPKPSATTSIRHDVDDAPQVSLTNLWEDICQNGLVNPLVVVVGRQTRDCKVDGGNQRIEVFLRIGISHVPVTAYVCERANIRPEILSPLHTDIELILPEAANDNILEFPHDLRQTDAPSNVFAKIRDLRNAGHLPEWGVFTP